MERLVRYMGGATSARIALMQPGADFPRDEVVFKVWPDSDWAGDLATRQSQSSLRIEADGCALFTSSRRQAATAHSSGEAEYYAGVAAACEGVYIKHVLEFAGCSVHMSLFLDSAAACGICRHEGVGKVRHLSANTLCFRSW